MIAIFIGGVSGGLSNASPVSLSYANEKKLKYGLGTGVHRPSYKPEKPLKKPHNLTRLRASN